MAQRAIHQGERHADGAYTGQLRCTHGTAEHEDKQKEETTTPRGMSPRNSTNHWLRPSRAPCAVRVTNEKEEGTLCHGNVRMRERVEARRQKGGVGQRRFGWEEVWEGLRGRDGFREGSGRIWSPGREGERERGGRRGSWAEG